HPGETHEAVQHTTSHWVVGRRGLSYPFWAREHGWDGSVVVFVSDNPQYRKSIEPWFDSIEEIHDPRLDISRRYFVPGCRNLKHDAAGKALFSPPQARVER